MNQATVLVGLPIREKSAIPMIMATASSKQVKQHTIMMITAIWNSKKQQTEEQNTDMMPPID